MSVIKKSIRTIKTANQPRGKNVGIKKMANQPCDEKAVRKTTSQPRNQKGDKNSRKRQRPLPYDKNMLYQPEKIVRKCRVQGKLYYDVKWVGYDENNNTWEPGWNMAPYRKMIEDFELREKNARKLARKRRARLRCQEKPPKPALSPSVTVNGDRPDRDADLPESSFCKDDDGLQQSQMHVGGSDGDFASSKKELIESLGLVAKGAGKSARTEPAAYFETPKRIQRESYSSPSPIENRVHRAKSNREQSLSRSLFDDSSYQHEDYFKGSRKARNAPRKRSSTGRPKNGERSWDTLQSIESPSAIENDTWLEREEDQLESSRDVFRYENDSRRRPKECTSRRSVERGRYSRSDQTMSEFGVLEEEVERIDGGTVGADGKMYFLIRLKNKQMRLLRNDHARRCIYRHLINFYEQSTTWLTDDAILL